MMNKSVVFSVALLLVGQCFAMSNVEWKELDNQAMRLHRLRQERDFNQILLSDAEQATKDQLIGIRRGRNTPEDFAQSVCADVKTLHESDLIRFWEKKRNSGLHTAYWAMLTAASTSIFYCTPKIQDNNPVLIPSFLSSIFGSIVTFNSLFHYLTIRKPELRDQVIGTKRQINDEIRTLEQAQPDYNKAAVLAAFAQNQQNK